MQETTQAPPKIEDWPVAPERQETNREWTLRALRRAHSNGVPICRGTLKKDEARCAVGVITMMSGFRLGGNQRCWWNRMAPHFDSSSMNFAEFADHLEDCQDCWGFTADDPYAGGK